MTLAGRLTLLFAATSIGVSAVIGGLSYAATVRALNSEIQIGLADAATTLADGGTPEGLPTATDPDDEDTPDTEDSPRTTLDEDDDRDHRDTDRSVPPTPAPTTAVASPSTATLTPTSTPTHAPRPHLLLAQWLSASGTPSSVGGRETVLPVTEVDLALAVTSGDSAEYRRTITVNGAPYLLLTRANNGPGDPGGAVQVARSLADRNTVLAKLAASVFALTVLVALAAALLGWFVAHRLTRRLVRLTAAAEQVSLTGRLDIPVPAQGGDEVGRLGAAFDTMLVRLARAKDAQQRLVQDAGHELRTPLTSIRTNLSLLRRFEELAPDERAAVLDDLSGESRELTELINELVELATDQRAEQPAEDVDVVALADRVAARARRRSGRRVEVVAYPAPLVIRGQPAALERAVSNLVDNAIKFDPDGTHLIELAVFPGRVEVRDLGPGIPPEDLPLIFDRFHRATAVRSLPGSGLGLSIVADVAAAHGGRVFAANRAGGGAVIGFTLGP